MDSRQDEYGEAPEVTALTRAIDTEQRYVDALYARLDDERERTKKLLAHVNLHGADGGTPQALEEREAGSVEQARRLGQLNSVDSGLCFGRIDLSDGGEAATYYIGRIGLRDAGQDALLVDWRAPAARPFYAASPSAPGDVVRRRQLHTTGRRVTGIDDEVFDLERIPERERRTLVGEAALLASLRRGRTGRMSDVVSTIQSEQDRVIRSGLPGVLVVQGGPGTGKSVAALHRAAYLLYTHRRTLARRGVLVVGPNAVFLRYIGEVLPSLGETDVVLTTLGGLFPGVAAEVEDAAEAAVVKGDPRMVRVIARAVTARQRVPGPRGLPVVVEGTRPGETETLTLPYEVCARARERARALGAPHNVARKRLVTDLLDALVRERAEAAGRPLDEEELRHGPGELWRQRTVREALDGLWPLLTPEELVGSLLSGTAALEEAAGPVLDARERAALLRSRDEAWTVGDVPLLDEAAELLGADDSRERALRRAEAEERRAEETYAREVLQLTGLEGTGLVDVETLLERHRDTGPVRTTADRAAADRSWVYGHVIVDEAQELSAMAWRTVMRRIPGRSMTIVGDVAQTGSPAGARAWQHMLAPYVGDRWREERLTVNYRTPAEVMEPAALLLAEVAPGLEPPESVRDGGEPPRSVRAAPGGLARAVALTVAGELAELRAGGGGRLALIAPDELTGPLAAALPEDVRAHARGRSGGVAVLDAPVAVLTVAQAKGLEFDRVVLADPVGLASRSPQGGHDLYVAATRVTQRLVLVHEGELSGPARLLTESQEVGGSAPTSHMEKNWEPPP